jgi:ABC-type glycerol-3-phosphate transport system substrate-binding protein
VLTLNARVGGYDEQQAALDVLRYLISAEAQQALLEGGKQPVLLSLELARDEHQAARAFRAQALQGQVMPNSTHDNDIVREELERMQFAVLRGLSSPAEAIDHTDAVLRERLGHPAPHP